jgi:hypothetical protein
MEKKSPDRVMLMPLISTPGKNYGNSRLKMSPL